MNTRLLGTWCVIGSAIWMLDGVRIAILGLPAPDLISAAAIAVWATGGLCGILGLIALRAMGVNPIFRLISYVPAFAFLCLIIGTVLRLINVFHNPADNWLVGIGFLTLLPGMLIVGILTLAAKTWTGVRKFAPLLPVLMFLIGSFISGITGLNGISTVLAGAGFVSMGYALASGEPVAPLRKALDPA